MTVLSSVNQVQSTAANSATDYTFTFPFQATTPSQIKVFVNGAEVTTGFTVLNQLGNAEGGSSGKVVFDSSSIPSDGSSVTVLRQTNFLQGSDYQNNDALDAETLEQNFDKLTYSVLQLKEKIDRSVRFDETLTGTNNPIINIDTTTRAGKLLSFDGLGAFTVSQELGLNRGNFVVGTAYNARDIVKADGLHSSINGNVYFCISPITTLQNNGYSVLTDTNSDGSAKYFTLLVDAVTAGQAKDDAVTAKNAAEAALGSFNNVYLGAATSAPSTTQDGAIWFDTQNNQLKVYDANSSPAAFIAIPTSTHISTVATNITNVNAVGGSISNVNTIANTSNLIANIATVATNDTNISSVAGISADIGTLADIEDGTVATDAISNVNAIRLNVSAVAGIKDNVTTVAGLSSSMTSVINNSTNINTVASNITDVNTFAERYRVAGSNPTTGNSEGDLYYNTTANQLRVFNGSSWESGVLAAGSGNLLASNNLSELSNTAATARSNLGITDESIAFSIALG